MDLNREKILLSDKRLLAAAEYVNNGESCVDVGTDHGYLSAFLYANNISKEIVACDINEKPLNAAKKTFEANGLADKISLRLSDGLQNISSSEAKNILICGMGGELILKIILSCPFEISEQNNLVLQPMTNVPLLRKGLYKNGFEIVEETPIIDSKHFYTVMRVKKSCNAKADDISDVFALVGKIPQSNAPDRKAYLDNVMTKLLKTSASLKNAKEKNEKLEFYENMISELNKICE